MYGFNKTPHKAAGDAARLHKPYLVIALRLRPSFPP